MTMKQVQQVGRMPRRPLRRTRCGLGGHCRGTAAWTHVAKAWEKLLARSAAGSAYQELLRRRNLSGE